MFSFSAPRIEEQDVAKELESMTEEERAQSFKDLYGHEEEDDETEEFLEAAYQKLEAALDSITEKVAYEEARAKCFDHVQDMRIVFLRCHKFDAESSAKRIVKYWMHKKKLFGENAFQPGVRLSDMDEEDFEAIAVSKLFLLPGRDKAGRSLLFITRLKWEYKRKESMLKAMWYWFHKQHSDSKGVVFLSFDMGNFSFSKYDRKLDKALIELTQEILPYKLCGFHYFTNSNVIDVIWPIVMFLMGKTMRARVVKHSRVRTEWLVKLKEYGIEEELLPTDMGGTLELDQRRMVVQLREEEKQASL